MNKNNRLSDFKQKHGELWKFIKFNITVLVTSGLDILTYLFCIYVAFKSLNTSPLPESAVLSFFGIRYRGYLFSYLISTSAGYIAAYLINRRITFRSDINPAYSSSLYFILAVFNIIVSTCIGGVFGSFMRARQLSNPLTEVISKFIIINIPTVWTYPIERYFIHRVKKTK